VKATLTSVRVKIGGSTVDAAPAAAAPATAPSAPGTVAAKPSIKLPPGTSAVVRLDLRPVTLVPTSGETVVVETVSVAIDAPGLTKPATVKANASITGTGAGAAKFPLALDAKLVDWGSADGSILGDRMRVDGTLKAEHASTRVLGALLGMGTELEEAIGPDITVDAAVASTAPGTIVFAGSRGGYGNMVEIDHGFGIHTRYGQLSRIIVGVGSKVNKGSIVGKMGSTGRSTGDSRVRRPAITLSR
jgi:hypothetical protein